MILCLMVPVKSTFYITAELNLSIFRNIGGALVGQSGVLNPFLSFWSHSPSLLVILYFAFSSLRH